MIASIGPGKAYIKGYEIVNKETKYLELNKARESLTSDNINLKSRGLPTYSITNVFGSVPLNKEGSDLTAYPDVFLYNTFNDGSIGLNNTELSTDHRQTIDRRGKYFHLMMVLKLYTSDNKSHNSYRFCTDTISKHNLELYIILRLDLMVVHQLQLDRLKPYHLQQQINHLSIHQHLFSF